MAKPKILIVATSHAQMANSAHATGVWTEELTTPYYVLLDAGAEVVLASISGGAIPFDPRSVPAGAGAESGEEPPEQQEVPPSVMRFLCDEAALETAQSTPPVETFVRADFDAIFLPGGHGAMWDMPGSLALAGLVGTMFDHGRIVAAVCHGPAGFVSARRNDGAPIVQARRVNAFSNSEEEAVGLSGTVPFLLEDRLKELGALWKRGPDWQPFAVRDGNLISGQNPHSSELVARHLLQALDEMRLS